MTWLSSISASFARVLVAGSSLPTASNRGPKFKTTRTAPVAGCGPALSIGQRSRPDPSKVDLTARALRVSNRCPKATALYLAVHETLRAGPSS